MVEQITKRNKPKFLRRDWNKMHKLGKKVKSKRKWHAAKGRDNKVRLKERGYPSKPTIGWGANSVIKNEVSGMQVTRVETLKDFDNFPKGHGVIIGSVGAKKKAELIKKATGLKITIINKYNFPAKGDKK